MRTPERRTEYPPSLLHVAMRAIAVGMGTFASLLVAAQAGATGQLADLSLRSHQGRLHVELTWQGSESPAVTTTRSDQGVVLEFEQAQLSQSLADRPLGSFPDLGIHAVEVTQDSETVRMGITVMPGTTQTELTVEEFSHSPQSQRFEVWVAGVPSTSPSSDARFGLQPVTVSDAAAAPTLDPAVADEAKRLEDLLGQVRQNALERHAGVAAEPSNPETRSFPSGSVVASASSVPEERFQPQADGVQPAAIAANPQSAPSLDGPELSPVSPSGSASIEDLLAQVRQEAWARQGTLSNPSSPIVPPSAPGQPAVPSTAASPPQSSPTPRAEELELASTSSTDLEAGDANPEAAADPTLPAPPAQPELQFSPLPDLGEPELTSTPLSAESQATDSEALILSPSLARQQNNPPPLIEPEPFLSRLNDSDIAAPLTRHSLSPFPGDDLVLLAAQPSPGLPDTRVDLLKDSSISTTVSPRNLTSNSSSRSPVERSPLALTEETQSRLPGQSSSSPDQVATNSTSSPLASTLLPSISNTRSFQSTLPAAGQTPAGVALPSLPGSALPSASPIAATEGIPSLPILTPSLERTQPLQIPAAPSFQTPAIRDLPGTTQPEPTLRDPLLRPQPFMGQLSGEDIAPPLQRNSLALVPILAQADLPGQPQPFEVAILPNQDFQRSLSPLERPPQRLFGFETGTILRHGEMLVHAGGTSFQNPNDFRTVLFDRSNRSNDLNLGFDIGLWDTVQLSIGAEGKDDTIFANLVAPDTGVSIIYQGIPVQLKWQAIESPRLNAALVTTAQFAANTVPGRIDNQTLSDNPSSRKVLITTDQRVDNALLAEDTSTYFSIAAPVTYQLDRQTRITFNPQASFFPESIPVTAVRGNAFELQEANIGFDGQRLNYFGTVVGLGLGLDYDFSRHIKFVADYTAIVSGTNSIGQTSGNSIFDSRAVWNAGFKFAPNSRLGIDLYATNRFGPVTYSPANILAQPGGDAGVGLEFTYLPDLGTTDYQIYKRGAYPEPSAFLSGVTTYSATVLPIGSAVYEVGSGGSGRFSQTARFGLLDDLELVLTQSSFSRPQNRSLAIEGGIVGRLATFTDRGQTGLAAALGAGLLGYEGGDGATTVALYGDFPMRFRGRNPKAVEWSFSPKVVIPTQASGDDTLTAFTLGANWPLFDNTHLLGEYTPVLQGGNQLTDRGRQRGEDGGAFLNQRASLFSLGVRQLFPTDNSLYALDVFWSNAAGNSGLQGMAALPDGETQIGIRFTTLNGIPDLSPTPAPATVIPQVN